MSLIRLFADIAAGAKFAYFGDFNRFIVRRVTYMTLKRLVERYAEYDQTASWPSIATAYWKIRRDQSAGG
jgi:predicted phage gp36 major capsid-like protein